jgi:hypothetical protein
MAQPAVPVMKIGVSSRKESIGPTDKLACLECVETIETFVGGDKVSPLGPRRVAALRSLSQ